MISRARAVASSVVRWSSPTLPKAFGQLLPNAKVAFYHSGIFDDETSKARRDGLEGELCMKRPARHRSSPMELALRRNPQAQQHCEAFSKHGLWRRECTESQQWPTEALICVRRITMLVALCERTTVSRGCLLGRGPAVRELQTRRRPTQLIPSEAMPRGQP